MDENELLAQLIEKRKALGTAVIAQTMGVTEVTIRSVCTGNYPGNTKNVLKQFAKHYVDVLHCPYIDKAINRDECKTRANGPKPFGGNTKQAWWQACQQCEHK